MLTHGNGRIGNTTFRRRVAITNVLYDTSPDANMCQPSRITVPEDGVYLIKANTGVYAVADAVPGGNPSFYITVNGTGQSNIRCGSGPCSFSHTMNLNPGDYVDLYYYWYTRGAGGFFDIGNGSDDWGTQLQVTYLGGT